MISTFDFALMGSLVSLGGLLFLGQGKVATPPVELARRAAVG